MQDTVENVWWPASVVVVANVALGHSPVGRQNSANLIVLYHYGKMLS